MVLTIPPQFKPITQYIRRAEKLDKATEPEAHVMAYCCRLYAIDEAFKLHDKSQDSTQFVTSLLARVEEEKKKVSDTFPKEDYKKICVNWTMKEFSRADEEDRSGLADQGTAKAFYVAGVYFDVLRQFNPKEGPGDPEMDRRRIYCKWKAGDILKAVKEGRAPTPGGVGEEVNTGMPPTPEESASPSADTPSSSGISTGESKLHDPLAGVIPEAPTSTPWPSDSPSQAPLDPYQPPIGSGGGDPLYPGGASAPGPSSAYSPYVAPAPAPYVAPAPAPYEAPAPAAYVAPAPAPYVAPTPKPYVAPTPAPAPAVTRPRTPLPSASGPRRSGVGGRPQEGNMADAMEHTRFALRALEFKDVELAVQELQEALRQIT